MMEASLRCGRHRAVFTVVSVVMVGMSLFTATPSQAAHIHRLVQSFTLAGSASPLEPAIDQSTGEVYVSAFSAGIVDAFEASGAPDPTHPELTEVDGSTPYPFATPYGVAVDNTVGPDHGDIYVADYSGGTVSQFDPSGVRTKLAPLTAADVAPAGTKQSAGLPPVLNNGALQPTGVAVASNGDIYVADQSNNVVDLFEANGTFVSQLAAGQISGPNVIALDASDNIYVAQNGSGLVEFEPSGVCVNSCTPIDPAANLGVAIGPEGNVYGDQGGTITEFNASAEPSENFGEGILSTGRGVAINDSNRDVYVADEGASKVDVFEPITVPTITILPVTNPGQTSVTLNGDVEPAGGGKVTGCQFEYGLEAGNYSLGKLPCLGPSSSEVGTPSVPIESPVEVHADLTALTAETTYHFRLVAANETGAEQGPDQTFTPHAVDDLKTAQASTVTPTTAILNGSFVGNGEDTHYYFEWGTETSYGNTIPIPSADAGEPAGPIPTTLSADLTNLQPATTYHYQLVAENHVGTSFGGDQSITTPVAPPVINAESVSDVHSDRALLSARINPGGADTKYHFEYGTGDCSASPDPCQAVPVPDVDVGSGKLFVNVSYQLRGLTPGTVYHYRVVATNEESPEGGTSGAEHSFTTFPFTPFKDECPNAHVRQQTGAALLLDCRAYELVSASNTNGYDVESDLVEGQTPFPGYPEASGSTGVSRLLYGVHDGGIPGTGDPTNHGVDPYVATRGPEGWSTKYVGIPANDPSAKGPFASTLLEADSSLDTLAFGGEEICSPCFGPGQTETGEPIHLPNGELVQGMAGSIPQPKAKPEGFIGKDLSANGEHFIFGSKSQFEPEGNNNGTDLSIYDRNLKTEETKVVSKTPSGQTMSGSGIGELDISSDGSHILIGQLVSEAGNAKYWHLYMNVGDSSKTTELTPGAKGGVLFDGMTSDGTKVFFSSEEHLTNQDSAHSGPDIYMWEEGKPLTLISKGESETPGQPGDSASCDPASNTKHVHWNTTGSEANCGDVAIGGGGGVASGDGTIYFLSPEQLDGSEGVQNAPNLYVVRPGGAPHFVATLESSANAALPEAEHPFTRSFGSLTKPAGVAIDQATGDVYVLDVGNTEANTGAFVEKFTSGGGLMTSFAVGGKLDGSGTPEGPLSEFGAYGLPSEIAVDNDPESPSHGDLYVPDIFHHVVDKFTSSGAYVSDINVSGLPTGVAVDKETGEVYVTNLDGGIEVYGPEGKSIRNFGTEPDPASVAVDSNGVATLVYVANSSKFAGEFSGIQGQTVAYNSEGEDPRVVDTRPSYGVSTDPANHDVYIDEGEQVSEFDASGNQISGPIGHGRLSGSIGLAANEDNLDISNPGVGKIAAYGPRVRPADPETDNPLVLDSVTAAGVAKSGDFQVTASGNDAVFTSTLSLTGYDNASHREVFRYDLPGENLECVSCSQTGEQATGEATLASMGLSLTDDGRVFFNSTEGLVDRDLNEREDVYEWEPHGAGPEESHCALTDGCLDLVSTGTSPTNSSLLSASSDGTDAFFFTREALAANDQNGNLVRIYDAREEGGFPANPPPVPCKASDECHGAGSPPPPSINIQSVGEAMGGNESPTSSAKTKCEKDHVRKLGRCVQNSKSRRHQHHKRGGHR